MHLPSAAGLERAQRLVRLNTVSRQSNLPLEEPCAVPAFLALPGDPAVALAQRLAGTDATTLVGFGNEAGPFQQAGIASVVCGAGFIAQAHQADEFVGPDRLARCEDLLAALAR